MFAETAPFLQEYRADPALIEAARAACEAAGVRHIVGKIATGDQFVGDAATKAAIAAKDVYKRQEHHGGQHHPHGVAHGRAHFGIGE